MGDSMRNVVIVGGGFAGVWAALAAARERAARTPTRPVNITLVSPEPWLTMRPRLYEASPQTLRVPLAGVLGPAGVVHIAATVRHIDTRAQTVTADTLSASRSFLGPTDSRREAACIDRQFRARSDPQRR
jgi:NADH dehydrogenase